MVVPASSACCTSRKTPFIIVITLTKERWRTRYVVQFDYIMSRLEEGKKGDIMSN